jgi:moderate conductance mechanosensitive channel
MPIRMPSQPWTHTALLIGLIALVSVAAFALVRLAIAVSLRQLLERRNAEAGRGTLPAAELERRVATIGRLAVRVAATVIAVIAALMVLGLFGINIGPALAGLGVVGIAVGFGAQSLIRDWFAGIFIVIENQYSEGDVVRIAGVEGVVQDFSLRRTTLRDLDGTVHSVPNGQIIVASNLTRLWTALHVEVKLADRGDSARAGEVINRVGRALKAEADWSPRLTEAPSVARVAADAGDGGVLQVAGQVRVAEREAAEKELRRRIVAELKDAGIRVKP